MIDAPPWLWVACTVAAGLLQTARNAMQRELTGRLGTIGATHVRFLYGLPFALLFLAGVAAVSGLDGLRPSAAFAGWVTFGAASQIAATALMLAAMRERSFVVATAYLKSEPLLIALFGLVFLGDRLGPLASLAVVTATAGVVLMSMPATAPAAPQAPAHGGIAARLRPAAFGIAAGGLFALSAVGFRGAILALGDAAFHVRATATLAVALALQSLALTGWLLARDRRVLRELLRAWRPSLLAGAAGATASQMWFLAFALQTAAAVRTLGLVEILFAHAASRRLFAQRLSAREATGIAMMAAGLALLLATTG